MGAQLGELIVSIAGDIAKLEASMTKAEVLTARTAKKMEDAMDRANKAVMGLAAGFVSFKAIDGIVDSISAATKAAAELEQMSKKTAVSAEELSKFKSIAKITGTDLNTVAAGIQGLTKSMFDTAAGTGKARDVFAALKIEVKDGNGQLKQGGDMLLEVAKKTGNLSNETQRLAQLQKLMKGSGAEMSEFMKELADAGELVAKVTNRQAWEAEQYERALRKLDSAKKSLYNTISQQVTPVMTALVRAMTEARNASGGLNDTAKKLAAENQIRQWAINAGIAVTMFIDGIRYAVAGIQTLGEATVILAVWAIETVKNIGTAVGIALGVIKDASLVIAGLAMVMSGQYLRGIELMKEGWSGLSGSVDQMTMRIGDSFSNIGAAADQFGVKMAERARDFKQGAATEAFLAQLDKVGEGFKETGKKAGTTTDIITKFKKDGVDNLAASLVKENAVLQASINYMQLYGKETKATHVAEVEAQLTELERNGTLAEHARRTGESVKVTKERLLGLAATRDRLQEIIEQEKSHIATLKELEGLTRKDSDRLIGLREELETYGMLPAAVTRYNAALLEERINILALFDADGKATEQMRARLLVLKDLANMQDKMQWMKEQLQVWQQMADLVGGFASRLVTDAGGAVQWLKDQFKQLLAEMIKIFATRWVLNVAANATGSAQMGTAAANYGQGSLGSNALSLAGSAANWMGGATGITGLAGDFAVGWGSGTGASGIALGAVEGATWATTAGAAMGEAYAALMSTLSAIPIWGWIAMAVVAVAAWIGGKHKGGPKVGGSFMGTFSGAGDFMQNMNVPGSDNGRFYTPNQGDTAMRDLIIGQGSSYGSIVRRLGGQGQQLSFGLGFDHDPQGTAQSRVSSMVANSAGSVIYESMKSMDDKAVPEAIALELKRQMIAALQATDINPYIDKIFDGVTNIAELTSEQIDAMMNSALEAANVIQGLANMGSGRFGLSLTIEQLEKFAESGETAGQTFQRVGGAWVQLVNAFSSSGVKMDAAQSELGDLYTSLQEFGYGVPTTREGWLDIMRSLDMNSEAGRELFSRMQALAGSFDAVTAASAESMDAFDKLMGKLRGPAYTQAQQMAQQGASLDAFRSANSWAANFSNEELIGALKTISREDFQNYSLSNRQLILAILGVQTSIEELPANIAAAQQESSSYVDMGRSNAADAAGNIASIFGSGGTGDFGQRTTRQIAAVQGAMDAVAKRRADMMESMGTKDSSGTTYGWVFEAQAQMEELAGTKNRLMAQLGRYRELNVMAPGHGEDLLNLENWYADAKAKLLGNTQGLLELEQEFQERRTKIITDAVAAQNQALDSLRNWRDSLLLNEQLSPLTLEQRVAEAASQYQTQLAAVQGGDTGAMSELQSAGTRYLELSRQKDASSPEYQALFRQIMLDTGGIVGESPAETNARLAAAVPTNGQMASSTDVAAVNGTLQDVLAVMMSGVKMSDPEGQRTLEQIRDQLKARAQAGGLFMGAN